MYIDVHGILTDQAGKVLIHRTGPDSSGIVSCPAEPGILPAETLAQAFRTSTGLIVHPVRLTGLYYAREKESSRLSLVYRCIMRGGSVLATKSGPVAGFFETNSLSPGLDAETKRHLDHSLRHAGGSPVMESATPGLWERLGRIFGGQSDTRTGGPDWLATVCLLMESKAGEVLWVRPDKDHKWQLPSAVVGANEAPWETAERLRHLLIQRGHLTPLDLRMVQLNSLQPAVDLVFSGRLTGLFSLALDSSDYTLRALSETGDDFAGTDIARVQRTIATSGPVIVQLGN